MLHKYPGVFSVQALLVTIGAFLICTAISEALARNADAGTEATIDEPQSHVLALRHLELPNYWVWYDGADLYNVIRAQKDKLLFFLGHVVFNAAMATYVYGAAATFVSYFIGVRALEPNGIAIRFLWVLPVAAFVADLAEDLAVIVCVIAFPHTSPSAASVAAWGSAAKFGFWALLALQWAVMVVKAFVAPPTKLRTA
jgi:hypothetical protein